MKKTGLIIGTICFAVIFIVFLMWAVLNITSERLTTATLSGGDTVAATNSGAGLRISAYEGLAAPDIRIEKMTVPSPDEDASVIAYDYSVSGKETFDTLLEVRVPYDQSAIAAGEDPADCVAAAYYNEAAGAYEPVIYEIDEENGEAVIITDHLSTYTTHTYSDKETRDAQSSQPNPLKLSDALTVSELPSYQQVSAKLQSGREPDEADAFSVGYDIANASFGLYGSAVSLISEIHYSSDRLSFLNDELGAVGTAFIGAQLTLDILKGDMVNLNTNLMKNLAGLYAGAITSAAGVTALTFDYVLNKLGEIKTERDQEYLKEYEAYYENYEKLQEAKNGGFHMRAYQEFYGLYKTYKQAGKTMPEEAMKSAVHKYVSDYCEMIFKDSDCPDIFQTEKGLTNELRQSMTDGQYREIMDNWMPSVFAALEKKIAYDARTEALRIQDEIEKTLNLPCAVTITSTNNYAGADNAYGGCIVRFDCNPEVMDAWTFTLDAAGCATAGYLYKDYLNAHMPTAAYIYASKTDMSAGQAMETVLFAYNEETNSIDINLGEEIEYELQASNTDIHVGDSVIFSVSPLGEGYTCSWNVTDDTAGYIQVAFSEAGEHTVTVEVYNAAGKHVATLETIVRVEVGDLTVTAGNTAPMVDEEFSIELLSDSYATATLYTKWDFGDGNTDDGYFDRYAYWYEESGSYTVTVEAYRVTDSGEAVFVASAQTVINVSDGGTTSEPSPSASPDGPAPTSDIPQPSPGETEAPAEFKIYSEITPATSSSQGVSYVRLTPELPFGYRYTSYSTNNSSGTFQPVVTMGSYSWASGTFAYGSHATYQVYWEIYDENKNLVCTTNTLTVSY